MMSLQIWMTVSRKTRGKVLDTLISLLEPTRSLEGCLSMELFQNSLENEKLLLSQLWLEKESLTRYIRGNRFRTLLVVADLLDHPPRFILSELAHELDLEEIRELMSSVEHRGSTEWGIS